jgi:hypothetical protein
VSAINEDKLQEIIQNHMEHIWKICWSTPFRPSTMTLHVTSQDLPRFLTKPLPLPLPEVELHMEIQSYDLNTSALCRHHHCLIVVTETANREAIRPERTQRKAM